MAAGSPLLRKLVGTWSGTAYSLSGMCPDEPTACCRVDFARGGNIGGFAFSTEGWLRSLEPSGGPSGHLIFRSQARSALLCPGCGLRGASLGISGAGNGTLTGPLPEAYGGGEYCLHASFPDGDEDKLLLRYAMTFNKTCAHGRLEVTTTYGCPPLDPGRPQDCRQGVSPNLFGCTFDGTNWSSSPADSQIISLALARAGPLPPQAPKAEAERAADILGLPGVLAACGSMALLLLLAACAAWLLCKRRAAASRRGHAAGGTGDLESCSTTVGSSVQQEAEVVLAEGMPGNWLLQPGDVELAQDSDGSLAHGRLCRGLLHRSTEVGVKPVLGIASASDQRALARELLVLARLRHPCVVQLLGVVAAEAGGVQLVLEWAGDTDLRSFVLDRRVSGAFQEQIEALQAVRAPGKPEKQVHEHQVLLDVVRAMAYLHGQKPAVLQRGLRPSGILVETDVEPPRAKLADARLDVLSLADHQVAETSGPYVAPEVVLGGAYGPGADVYAFGCVDFFTCTAKEPRPPSVLQQLREERARGGFEGLERAARAAEACLAEQPEERPSFQAIFACMDWGQAPAGPPL